MRIRIGEVAKTSKAILGVIVLLYLYISILCDSIFRFYYLNFARGILSNVHELNGFIFITISKIFSVCIYLLLKKYLSEKL